MRLANLLVITLTATACLGSDADFLRAWEQAQQARPSQLGSVGRIAPASEPGTALTIRGRVLDAAGRPCAGAVVFAWQTDRDGLYDRRGSAPHSWRLRGWTKTDEQGKFTFLTIRPAAYPQGREPAHVHFSIETSGRRYFADDLRFADDPLVRGTPHETGAAKVATVEGRQSVAITLRLAESNRF